MELSVWQWFGRLLLAAALGGIVGFERGSSHKAAGVRTNMMVALGAATFTAAAFDGFGPGEASRIAATIVTGVGFLGAGAIFRQGLNVTGLTTAASLWTVAAIGMTAGAGELVPATAVAVVAIVILQGLHTVEAFVRERALRHGVVYEIRMDDVEGVGPVLKMMERVDERSRIVSHRSEGEITLLVFRIRPQVVETLDTAIHSVDHVIDARIID